MHDSWMDHRCVVSRCGLAFSPRLGEYRLYSNEEPRLRLQLQLPAGNCNCPDFGDERAGWRGPKTAPSWSILTLSQCLCSIFDGQPGGEFGGRLTPPPVPPPAGDTDVYASRIACRRSPAPGTHRSATAACPPHGQSRLARATRAARAATPRILILKNSISFATFVDVCHEKWGLRGTRMCRDVRQVKRRHVKRVGESEC